MATTTARKILEAELRSIQTRGNRIYLHSDTQFMDYLPFTDRADYKQACATLKKLKAKAERRAKTLIAQRDRRVKPLLTKRDKLLRELAFATAKELPAVRLKVEKLTREYVAATKK